MEAKVHRIEFIDVLKALSIFLVVWGHTATGTSTSKLLYSFHMPLFFFISGIFLKEIQFFSWKDEKIFIKKKFNSLLMPYLIWALIYTQFSFRHCAFIAYGTRETLLKAGSLSSLWFLPVMFLGLISAHVTTIACKQHRNVSLVIFISLFLIVGIIIPHPNSYGLPFGLDVSFVATAFILLGFAIRKFMINMDKKLNNKWFCALPFAIIILLVLYRHNGFVLMANGKWGNPFFFLSTSISGIVATVLAALLVKRMVPKRELLLSIGQNTLGIMLVHKPIIELLRRGLGYCNIDCHKQYIFLLIVIITILISNIIVNIIKRTAPSLLGIRYCQDIQVVSSQHSHTI